MTKLPIRVGVPARPGNNATVTLLDTSTLLSKMGLRMAGIHRVLLTFPNLDQASATGGLIGYTSGDHGTNWDLCTFAPSGDPSALPQTVAATTASDCSSFDIDVSAHDDVKLTFTAGATAPSAATWAQIVIVLEPKRVSGV